jgi:hypothetical protein
MKIPLQASTPAPLPLHPDKASFFINKKTSNAGKQSKLMTQTQKKQAQKTTAKGTIQ